MNAKERKPFNETFHWERSFSVADCGDFEIIEHVSADIKRTTFFDQEGNPIRRQAHWDNHGSYTNSITGKTIYTTDHFTRIFDLVTGEEMRVGIALHIQIPGQGVVALSAGNVVFDGTGNITFEAGPHDYLHDYLGVMCPLLR